MDQYFIIITIIKVMTWKIFYVYTVFYWFWMNVNHWSKCGSYYKSLLVRMKMSYITRETTHPLSLRISFSLIPRCFLDDWLVKGKIVNPKWDSHFFNLRHKMFFYVWDFFFLHVCSTIVKKHFKSIRFL